MTEKTMVTDELSEYIESLDLLSNMLPYEFGDKRGRIEQINIRCASCGKENPMNETRATLVTHNQYSVEIRAYSPCFSCRVITPIEARYASTGEALLKGPFGWAESHWYNKPGLVAVCLEKIRALLVNLL